MKLNSIQNLHGQDPVIFSKKKKIRNSIFFLRLVYPMLPDSLDSPFLIAVSLFSDVYLMNLLNSIITGTLSSSLWIIHIDFNLDIYNSDNGDR